MALSLATFWGCSGEVQAPLQPGTFLETNKMFFVFERLSALPVFNNIEVAVSVAISLALDVSVAYKGKWS